MKKTLTALILAASVVSSSASAYAEAIEAPAEELTLEEAAAGFFDAVMESSPVNAHFSYALPGSYELEYIDPLGYFYEENADYLEMLYTLTDELELVDTSSLDAKDRKVYTWLSDFAEDELSVYELPDYYPTLSPVVGILTTVDTLITEYTIFTEGDIENYIILLKDVPRFLGEVVKELDYQEGIGFVPSRYEYEQLLDRREEMCSAEDHVYYEAFERNLSESGIDEAVRGEALGRVEKVIAEEVVPAYSAFFDDMAERSKSADRTRGLCDYLQGKTYYAALAKENTGTDMTPEELAGYLDKNIEADYAALVSAYSKLGFGDDPENIALPADTAEKALDQLREYCAENMPEIDLPGYTLSYLPEALQVEGNLAYYVNAPLDLPDFNVIRVNGAEIDEDDTFTLWTTMAHEGYPGHLYQYQYFLQESLRYPVETILGSIGTSEGWAFYVERLALKWAGTDDALADAAWYNETLGMALMCRVDIGVNYEGWKTRDIERFLRPYYGRLDSDVLDEFYDSVASSPGIYLPYGVGYYKTRDLFEAIRPNYISDEAMYEAYLNLGSMPFTLLEFYLGADGSL